MERDRKKFNTGELPLKIQNIFLSMEKRKRLALPNI